MCKLEHDINEEFRNNYRIISLFKYQYHNYYRIEKIKTKPYSWLYNGYRKYIMKQININMRKTTNEIRDIQICMEKSNKNKLDIINNKIISVQNDINIFVGKILLLREKGQDMRLMLKV